MSDEKFSPGPRLRVVPSSTAECKEKDFRFLRRIHEREDEFLWAELGPAALTDEKRKRGMPSGYVAVALAVVLAVVLAGMLF